MIVAERKIIQVEEKVPFKLLLPLSLATYVCDVRCFCFSSVYFLGLTQQSFYL